MPRGTVVPLLPRVGSTVDVRPRDPPDSPGSGSLPSLFAYLRANKWPALSDSAQAGYRQLVKLAEYLNGDGYPSVGDVSTWVTWLRREYPPPEGFTDSWTVHSHWKNLVAVYNDGREHGLVIGANPAALLKLKKPTPRARAIVDLAEVWPSVLAVCHDLRERTFLQLAYDLGPRKGELLGLMPHDLVTTCEPWRLRFERQRPKGNKLDLFTTVKNIGGTKASPITEASTRAMLAELLAQGAPRVWVGRGRQKLIESPLIFPYRTNDVMDLRRRVGAVAPRAFPPGDWLHAIRHTFAVEMNRSGASNEEVQRALGHLSPQSTVQTYINRFARPVDAGPIERMQEARRAGVVKWGAPPGGTGPPAVVASGPKSGTAPAGTGAAPRRSTQSSNQRGQEAACLTPSRKRSQRALPGLAVGPVVKKPRRKP